MKKMILFISTLIFSVFITSCGKCNKGTPVGSLSDLQIASPYLYVSGVAVNVPVVIQNTKGGLVSGIHYSVINNTTGVADNDFTIPAEKCASIAPNSPCTLMIGVPASSKPGSFILQASVGNVGGWVQKVENKLKLSDVLSINSAPIGLVPMPVNLDTGANGISDLSPTTVVANATGGTVVNLTFVVASASAGSFNTIGIVDLSGNAYPYTIISANSGAGMTNLSQGTVVSLAVLIPAGNTTFTYKIQTLNSPASGAPTVVSTATNSSTINVLSASVPVAELNALPNSFNLDESALTQLVTIYNAGTGTASNLADSITAGAPAVTITAAGDTPCAATLESGASCTYLVTLDKDAVVAGSGAGQVTYSGGNAASAVFGFNYTGAAADANMTIIPNPLTFQARTRSSSVTNQITLTNAGNVALTNFTSASTNASVYSLSLGSGAGSCGALPSTGLAKGTNCTATITYTNSAVTPETQSDFTINYDYVDRDRASQSSSSTVATTYQTIQSTAELAITAKNFDSIVNNNVSSNTQVFTITNNGDETATNVTLAFSNGVFKTVGNVPSSIESGAVESITVQFGPVAPAVVGFESSTMTATYDAFQGQTPSVAVTSNEFNGTVIQATQANIVISQSPTESANWLGGNGTNDTPFATQVSSTPSPTVTYTLTNTESAATGVFVGLNNIVAPWSVANNGCGIPANPISLGVNATCTITLGLNNSESGIHNITPDITVNWTDQVHPNGTSATQTAGMLYATVYSAPTITTISSLPSDSVLYANESFKVTAQLTPGYNTPNQSISFAVINDADNSVSPHSASCVLSQESQECSQVFKVGRYLANAEDLSVTITNTTADGVNVSPSSYNFSVNPWSLVGGNIGGTNTISSIKLDSSRNIYAGSFGTDSTRVSKYNGSSWSPVGGADISGAQQTNSIALDRITGNIYAGGNTPARAGAVWQYNGSSWSMLGGANISGSYAINSILFDGGVWVGGQTASITGAVWGYYNSSWHMLGGADISGSHEIKSISFDTNGNLYAGGITSYIAGAVWKYDGLTWNKVGGSNIPNSIRVYSILFDTNGNLYVGGMTDSMAGAVWKYDGSSWSEIGGADISGSGWIKSISFDTNGNLYAGGTTDSNTGAVTGAVWKYDGSSWSEAGGADIPGSGEINSILFDTNGNLYAGGSGIMGGAVWVYK